MKGAVDEARRKRLIHAGGRRTTQPNKSESAWAQAVAVLLGIWQVPLSKLVVLNQLVVEESEIAFARIKIDFMVLTALNGFARRTPES